MRINEITVFNSTLSGLEPYTFYDVRVAAFTNGGTGESPGARTRTLESGTLIVCPTYHMNRWIRAYWAALYYDNFSEHSDVFCGLKETNQRAKIHFCPLT